MVKTYIHTFCSHVYIRFLSQISSVHAFIMGAMISNSRHSSFRRCTNAPFTRARNFTVGWEGTSWCWFSGPTLIVGETNLHIFRFHLYVRFITQITSGHTFYNGSIRFHQHLEKPFYEFWSILRYFLRSRGQLFRPKVIRKKYHCLIFSLKKKRKDFLLKTGIFCCPHYG